MLDTDAAAQGLLWGYDREIFETPINFFLLLASLPELILDSIWAETRPEPRGFASVDSGCRFQLVPELDGTVCHFHTAGNFPIQWKLSRGSESSHGPNSFPWGGKVFRVRNFHMR